MADQKLTQLLQDDSLDSEDVLYVVIDTGGTPLSRKVLARRLAARHTTAQMNGLAAPQAGDWLFNTDQAEPFFYNGTDWVSLVDGLPE